MSTSFSGSSFSGSSFSGSSSGSSASSASSASCASSASGPAADAVLAALGYRPSFAAALAALGRPELVPARVVAHLGERLQLAGAVSRHAAIAGRLAHEARPEDRPTVGDWVAVSDGAAADQLALVHHVLPRHSAMIRRAAGRRGEGQAIAANVDTFLVVTSANRDANPRRVERYLAAVWDSGARPLLVINKADLCTPAQLAELVDELAACAPHVDVLPVSAATGEGFAALVAAAQGLRPAAGAATPLPAPTIAFVGMSGVGKSSLVNRLLAGDAAADAASTSAPEQQQQQHTLPIDDNDRGRHATSRRDLFTLPGGLVVIDTPGMRSLGLIEDEGGLDASFAEIAELAAACRFTDCSHQGEPGCAVAAALHRGELDPDRLAARHKLEREVRAAELRRDPAFAANAKRRMKTINVAQRARYKLDPKSTK